MSDYLDNMMHPGKQNHKLDHNILHFINQIKINTNFKLIRSKNRAGMDSYRQGQMHPLKNCKNSD